MTVCMCECVDLWVCMYMYTFVYLYFIRGGGVVNRLKLVVKVGVVIE